MKRNRRVFHQKRKEELLERNKDIFFDAINR